MRFLLLLLPNFYDIFTAIMIGYAFMLHGDAKLKIPFALACLLIYATTRIGIFAGKLIHKIIGNAATEPEGEQTPEVLAKRMILDFGPQCVLVVICQLILALLFLNPTAGAEAKQLPPIAQPVQEAEQVQAEAPVAPEQIEAAIPPAEETAKTQAQAEPDNIATDAEAAAAEAKKAVNKTTTPAQNKVKTYNRSSAKKTSTQAKVDPNNTGDNSYAVDIPERTLKTAGISPSEININKRQSTAQEIAKVAASSRTNSNSWTFAAANTTSAAQSAISRTSLQPKRYPGDDNPLQTNWGYYRNYSNGVDITKNKGTAAKQQKSADPVYNTIPARTLKSIGY